MASAEDLKQYNLITYILYILGFFLGLTPFIAIVMNYIKRDEMRGTWLESHVDWQIKTFWISLLGYIVGGLLTCDLDWFPDCISGLYLAYLPLGQRVNCLK